MIGYPDKKGLVHLSGNPGMVGAGSGDELTGVIMGVAGLKFSIDDAVPVAFFCTIWPAILRKTNSRRQACCGDIMEHLLAALKTMPENFETTTDFRNIANHLDEKKKGWRQKL